MTTTTNTTTASEATNGEVTMNELTKRSLRRGFIIVNLTQHEASAEQINAGVELAVNESAKSRLNFEGIPSKEDVRNRATALAITVDHAMHDLWDDIPSGRENEIEVRVLIGGAPFLMGPLAEALKTRGFVPVFAFSRRESVEVIQADGSTRKTAIFRHLGFVEG